MCNPSSSHKEEEYTDYSCSTAVERLSRDIESLLRSWHIHNGCDRHFSVSVNPKSLTLLRAERLTWVANFPQGRQPLRLELELSLWDGPAQPPSSSSRRQNMRNKDKQKRRASVKLETNNKIRDKRMVLNRRGSLSNDECRVTGGSRSMNPSAKQFADDYYEQGEEEECCSHLPKSIQRPQEEQQQQQQFAMPDSLFDNFSTLFGIGQHLTLTPTNPLVDLGLDNYAQPSSSMTQQFLAGLLQRHAPPNAKWALTQLLANWLQSALNCATMNCHCCIPAFGLWGNYPCATLPSDDDEAKAGLPEPRLRSSSTAAAAPQDEINVYPPWLEAARSLRLPTVIVPTDNNNNIRNKQRTGKHRKTKKGKKPPPRRSLKEFLEHGQDNVASSTVRNSRYLPPCVTGSVLPVQDAHAYAQFTCSVLPVSLSNHHDYLRLSHWGNVLLNHCTTATQNSCNNNSNPTTVVLSGARHLYAWQKANDLKSSYYSWRGEEPKDYWMRNSTTTTPKDTSSFSSLQEVEHYRQQCRAYALQLLEETTGVSPKQPGWGPIHDPIAAIHANIIWSGTTSRPLLSFPYPVDSFNSEVSMERSVLDPYRTPSKFRIQTFLDHQSIEATLATSQRCVLACLVRTATLAPLTLLQHLLWEEDIVEDWDHGAGNAAAVNLANQTRLGDATHTLVDVMDWKTCAEEMISMEEAEAIVQEVLDGWRNFPDPPKNMLAVQYGEQGDPLLAPLFRSAPLGRLVSDLMVRLARLRTSCSMALVWSTFCDRLRQRWDARESLPHMNYVPGLDPSPQALKETRQVSTIGVKAELSALWGGSEPDPDGQHCIIGQKLQLFNIGVETVTALEAQSQHRCGSIASDGETSWAQDLEESNVFDETCTPMPKRAASIVSLSSEMPGPPLSSSLKDADFHSGRVVDLSSLANGQIPNQLFRTERDRTDLLPTETALTGDNGEDVGFNQDQVSTSSDSDFSAEFFDAEECALGVFSSPSALFSQNAATSVAHRIERKGARCPVHGYSLVASGDQLYAPYLQRPQPLTDDLTLERRAMLSDQSFASELSSRDTRMPIQNRLEIVYRLQKPKLLSDMKAFKASNPGAVFQDFVSWYGNPGNPLDDYNPKNSLKDDLLTSVKKDSTSESISMKLDKAAEAIHILNETRNFWSSTWDEAVPAPASEQTPLYDVYSTVEMAIDYLENMHPAILLNQIMAVNLANAYFTLVASAKDGTKVEIVNKSLLRLRKQIEVALEMLAEEAANATCSFYHYAELEDNMSNFVSVEAIMACESACASLSEAEVMTSLGTSLLEKFPGQYEIVETILKESDGCEIDLLDVPGRACILDSIYKQQQSNSSSETTKEASPQPVLQEYLLRNFDDAKPCQLSVRYGNANPALNGIPNKDSAALMIALTKTQED